MTDYSEPWYEGYNHINSRVEIIRRSDGHVVGYIGNMLFSRRQRVLKCVNACRGIEDPERVVPLLVDAVLNQCKYTGNSAIMRLAIAALEPKREG